MTLRVPARRFLPLSLALLALALPAAALAASPAAAAAPTAKLQDIRRLLALTGSGNLGKQMASQMIDSFKQAIPNVPAAFWEEFVKEIDPDELVEMIVPIYDRHFSHDDVKALIRFYESPAGKKFVATLPAISRESMEVGQAFGERLGRKIQQRLEAEQKGK